MSPVGDKRRIEGRVALGWLFGATASSCVVFLALFAVGTMVRPLPISTRLAVFVVLAGPVALSQLVLGRCALPQNRWQIPSTWVEARDVRSARDFGAVLGCGFMTYIPSCSPFIIWLGAVLVAGSVSSSLALALGFGVGRSLDVVLWAAGGNIGSLAERVRSRSQQVFETFTPVVAVGLVSVSSLT